MTINWVAQLTYTAPGLTAEDLDSLTRSLEGGRVRYAAETSQLLITVETAADTLREAAERALAAAAAVTGLLKPTRLYLLPSAEFVAGGPHPGAEAAELIGMTEIGNILGVSRQRASKLAQTEPTFPAPVRPGPRALYSRPAIEAFDKQWKATRNPRGGPRPRTRQIQE